MNCGLAVVAFVSTIVVLGIVEPAAEKYILAESVGKTSVEPMLTVYKILRGL